MPAGAKTTFKQEIFDEILDRISEGELLTHICKSDNKYPQRATFLRWTRISDELRSQYALAREDQQHCWADEIMMRGKDESRDYYVDDKGIRRSDNTAVQRDRLICDNTKWLMARLAHRVYGDKIEQQLTGKDGESLSIVVNVNGKKEKGSNP